MSQRKISGHSDCGSDCSLDNATERDYMELEEDLTGGQPPTTEDTMPPITEEPEPPFPTDGWEDNESYHSGRSVEEIEHSALHWTACKDEHCDYHSKDNTYRERTRGSPPSMPCSPPIVYPDLPRPTSA